MLVLGMIIGLIAGAVAGWLLRPKLEAKARLSLPFLATVAEPLTAKTLHGRLDAAIAEIESQISQGLDRERNATRLQILREVKVGD